MFLPYTYETGWPITIGGKDYLLYMGELLPSVWGGTEPPEKDEDDPPAPPPDLQTILAAVTKEVGKTIKSSLKPLQEKLNTIDTWRQEMDTRLKPPESEEDEPPVLPGLELSDEDKARKAQADGALKKQVRELHETVSRLTTENKDAQKRTEEVTKKERLTSRDRMLSDSLAQLGVVSLDGGVKFFKDDVQFDEETDEWSFSTKDGARYTIPEMVQKFTPDWLRKPLVAGGGSGGGKPQGAAAHKADISRVRTLHESAQQSGTNSASMAYWRARKDALAKGIPAAELDAAVS